MTLSLRCGLLLGTLLCICPAAAQPQAGLVGYWSFDEGTGVTAADASGSGNTGTLQGSAGWSTATPNGSTASLDLNGASGTYVRVPDAGSLDVTAITVAAWIYIDRYPSTYPTIVAKPRSAVGTGWEFDVRNNNTLEWEVASASSRQVCNGGTLSTGTWYHVAGTYDGQHLRIYVDGTLAGTCFFGQTLSTNNDAMEIGSRGGGGSPFDGRIDELRLYDRALDDDQIAVLAGTLNCPPPSWDGTVADGGDGNRYLRVTASCGLDYVEFWNTANLSVDGLFTSGDGGATFQGAADYAAYTTGACNVEEPALRNCSGFAFQSGTQADELWVRVSAPSAGNSTFFLALNNGVSTTNIDPVLASEPSDVLPEAVALEAAYPNPFNPTTRLAFTLPEAAAVELAIYDLLGRRVATLVDARVEAGRHTATWHGRDAGGRVVPSGTYLVRLTAGAVTATRRVTLLK